MELESLVTYLLGDNLDLKKKLTEAEQAFKHFEKVANKSTSKVMDDMERMGKSAIGLAASIVGIGGAMDAAFRGIRLAADAEALSVTFRVLVGDVEKADAALRDLQKFALTTPFEMPELMEASRMMLAFGEEVENIVPAMRMMGDIAAGVDVPLKDLAYLFGTLRAQGRAFTVDIRQFASRGIPIYLELAKVFNLVSSNATKTTKEVRQKLDKMIEAGQVSFEQVEEAFKRMTGPGGKFFNMMDARSKTLKGLFNEMKESIDLSLRAIGESLIKGLDLHLVVKNITKATEAFNQWLGSLSVGTRKAIILMASLAAMFAVLTVSAIAFKVVLSFVFGPLGLVIGAITTLIGLTTMWVDSVGGLQEAWAIVKMRAEEFWNFIRPALPALLIILAYFFPVLAAIGVAVALVADNWDEVSAALSTFWAEAKPILRDVRELLNTIAVIARDHLVFAFETIVDVVKMLGETAADIQRKIEEFWQSLTDGGKDALRTVGALVIALMGPLGTAFEFLERQVRKPWSELKKDIREAIMSIEFFFHNFRLYFMSALADGQLFMTRFFDGIEDFFTRVMPKVLSWFQENWKAVFMAAWNIGKAFVGNLVQLIISGVESVPDIITGKLKLTDLLADHFNSFKVDVAAAIGEVPALTIGPRQKTEAEKAAEALVEEYAKAIGFEWERFKKNREKQFALEDAFPLVRASAKFMVGFQFMQAEDAAMAAGERVGISFGAGLDKGMPQKWDAVLSGSAEAISRLESYKSQFPIDLQQKAEAPKVVVQTTPPPPNSTEVAMLQQLVKIAVGINQLVNKPGVQLIPAALD